MYELPLPLQHWVIDGYPGVIRHTGWDKARARREVHRAIRAMGYRPHSHADYEYIRSALLRGDHINHDLV